MVEIDREKVSKIINKIEENVNICCGITMEPFTVEELIDKLREELKLKKPQ